MILLSLSLFRCFISSEACQIMFVSLCRCGCWQAGREIHHDIRGSVSQALPKPPPLGDWWTAGWGTFVLEKCVILYMKWYMKLEEKCCVLFVLFIFLSSIYCDHPYKSHCVSSWIENEDMQRSRQHMLVKTRFKGAICMIWPEFLFKTNPIALVISALTLCNPVWGPAMANWTY